MVLILNTNPARVPPPSLRQVVRRQLLRLANSLQPFARSVANGRYTSRQRSVCRLRHNAFGVPGVLVTPSTSSSTNRRPHLKPATRGQPRGYSRALWAAGRAGGTAGGDPRGLSGLSQPERRPLPQHHPLHPPSVPGPVPLRRSGRGGRPGRAPLSLHRADLPLLCCSCTPSLGGVMRRTHPDACIGVLR